MSENTSDSQHFHEEMKRVRLGWRLAQSVRFLLSLLRPSPVAPVALLIDGDNISSDLIAHILVEAGKFGGVTIRRVYGNWGSPSMQPWKNVTTHYALQQVHSAQIATGKNAADIALVIDAMDLLYRDQIERFCLVTSDSDYTALALRLRAAGCLIVGIGRPTTPPALMQACTVFVPTDQLTPAISVSKPTVASERASSSPPGVPTKLKPNTDLTALLTNAYGEATKGKGTEWVLISRLGLGLKKLDPAFTTKSYGYKDLSSLVKSRTDLFETRQQNTKGGQLEVRVRR
ncbi:MAG: NYN domain-containing protein [Chloroflexota bacterium]|nr:NYN domain-containing protein [Chloroflexota bacterium]